MTKARRWIMTGVFVLGGLSAPLAAAGAAAPHSTSTSAEGVTYDLVFSPAIWNVQSSPAGGTFTDGTTAQSNRYSGKIVCAKYVRSTHTFYFGIRVTGGVKPGGLPFVFWAAKAGGSGVGSVAGEPYATKTCYDGSNGSLVGPFFVITAGTITIS